MTTTPEDVIAFWREAGPDVWFTEDAEFDRRFRERFAEAHAAAARGELADWQKTATGALALVILLDQYPRNAFRGSARMYATDSMAREVAEWAIDRGYDRQVDLALRAFFVLPFEHSESLADQDRGVAMARQLGEDSLTYLPYALQHRDIIRRFGRFPHRNPILGRATTEEEQHFLDEGGFSG